MKLKKLLNCLFLLNLLALGLFAQTESRPGDSCPVVSIAGPAGAVRAGETITFTAMVSGDFKDLGYDWSLDKGRIVSGQGTASITVATDDLDGVALTATVEVRGNFLAECNARASETGLVEAVPKPYLFDKFAAANCEYVLMVTDGYLVQLSNQPDAQGYVVIYGGRGARRLAEFQVSNQIKMRNFPPDRITIVYGGGTGKRAEIEMWLIPPGAVPPEIEERETEPEPEPAPPTKPYIFSSEYSDGVGGCSPDENLDSEGYAGMLKDNPKYRGNIVIITETKVEFREKEKEILNFLKSKGIARKRLRTFYVEGFVGVELWILP